VLLRGLVLRCKRCRQTDWYLLDDIGQSFRCRRCYLHQRVEGHWTGTREPAWFYALAEVVHQFLDHNGEVPVLAADRYFADGKRVIDHGVELEFFPPEYDQPPKHRKKSIEVDIAVSNGHELWLGEAARNFKPSKQRMTDLRRLATVAGAHGLLLATAADSFPAAVCVTAKDVFRRREPIVEWMTSVA
jgi:hypothetical protein